MSLDLVRAASFRALGEQIQSFPTVKVNVVQAKVANFQWAGTFRW